MTPDELKSMPKGQFIVMKTGFYPMTVSYTQLVIICAGGTQVIPEEAVKTGIDMGFGRDSHGIDVATFLAEERQRRRH